MIASTAATIWMNVTTLLSTLWTVNAISWIQQHWREGGWILTGPLGHVFARPQKKVNTKLCWNIFARNQYLISNFLALFPFLVVALGWFKSLVFFLCKLQTWHFFFFTFFWFKKKLLTEHSIFNVIVHFTRNFFQWLRYVFHVICTLMKPS